MHVQTFAKYVGVFVLMLIAVILTFGSSVQHDFVAWDDTILITENPIVTKPNVAHTARAFSTYDPELYIPLTFVSYQINTLLCGVTPSCFHATDIVLHSINATLVFAVLSLLISSDLIALLLAVLFALHPLNAEAVVWASARKDTLSTLFFLGALLAYIQTRRSSQQMRWMGLSLGFFCLGLLSKVSVITLPVIFLLIDLLEQRREYKRMFVEKIPFIVLAIIFGIVAVIGKSSVLESTTFIEKVLMAGRSTVFYLTSFILPVDLSVMVPYAGKISLLLPAFSLSIIVVLILGAIAFSLRKKFPAVFFGALFFFVTLLPSFTNFSKGGDIYIASDRYAYIPMIGLFIVIGTLLHAFLEQSSTKRILRSRQNVIVILCIGITGVFARLSYVQSATWENSTTLFEHTISLYPTARSALSNLGMERLKERKFTEALDLFNQSLAIRSDASVRANKASAMYLSGNIASAKKEYLDILKTNPMLAEAHYNLGNIAQREGNSADAIRYYKDAIAIDPMYFRAQNNLAGLYADTGDIENAGDTYAFLSDAYPDIAEPAFNAGVAYEHLQQFSVAEKYYERAKSIDPTDATTLASLATVLYEQGKIDLSARTLMQAIDIDPNNATAITLVLRMKKDGYAK